MTSIDIHPGHMQALQAIADLDGTDVDTVVALMLDAALDARLRAIERAYLALTGRAPAHPYVAPPAVEDTCDDCGQRHGPGDPECGGPDDSPPPPKPAGRRRTCERDGCTKKHQARGMCSSHWARWRDGREPVAPDGTRSPAAADTSDEVEEPEDPDPDDLPDDELDVDTGDQVLPAVTAHATPGQQIPPGGAKVDWDRIAPRTTSAPAELDVDDPMCCQAARCRAEKIAEDAKFCPHHTSQVPRIAEKLRRGAKPPANPFEVACERLIAGRR